MNKSTNTNSTRRSACPIACTLDIVGDKWTVLIIRDMLYFGKSRFDEFLASPEKISTNILTSRLKRMEENGLIVKNPYGAHSQRMNYEPTEKGKSLAEIVKQIAIWGKENIPDAGRIFVEQKEKEAGIFYSNAALNKK